MTSKHWIRLELNRRLFIISWDQSRGSRTYWYLGPHQNSRRRWGQQSRRWVWRGERLSAKQSVLSSFTQQLFLIFLNWNLQHVNFSSMSTDIWRALSKSKIFCCDMNWALMMCENVLISYILFAQGGSDNTPLHLLKIWECTYAAVFLAFFSIWLLFGATMVNIFHFFSAANLKISVRCHASTFPVDLIKHRKNWECCPGHYLIILITP